MVYMRLLQISLLISIMMSFTTKEDSYKEHNVQKTLKVRVSQDSTIHYLALGDSYTAGTSVRAGKSFPSQLTTCLQKKLERKVKLEVIAKAGWRTDDLLGALKSEVLKTSYDVVTICIGVNNHYQKKSFGQYKKEFPRLLEQAIKLAGGDASHVFVISIPDWAYTPFGEKDGRKNISKEIDKYNAFAKKTTDERKARFISITDLSREGLNDANLVAKDGLHPSGMAYQRFVERICPSITTVLNRK